MDIDTPSNQPSDTPTHYYRRVFKIRGEDSPNVRLARAEQAAGKQPSGRIIIPGVLPYADYLRRRATWDKILQCIGLDGEFYEGAENLLYPPQWLNHSEHLARKLRIDKTARLAKGMGIDPAEGGDKTAMSAVDQYGLIEQVSKKTPDTTVVTAEAIAFGIRHNIPPERWVFDRGGGGKEHADRLRQMGYNVRTVAFGESIQHDPRRGTQKVSERLDEREERYAYRNRRAQMYGELSLLMDPYTDGACSIGEWASGREFIGFAIPEEYVALRHQLSLIPKTYDPEGRLELLPKNKRPESPENSKKKTLVELIGYSPDEADSLVLAVHAMLHRTSKVWAGAVR